MKAARSSVDDNEEKACCHEVIVSLSELLICAVPPTPMLHGSTFTFVPRGDNPSNIVVDDWLLLLIYEKL